MHTNPLTRFDLLWRFRKRHSRIFVILCALLILVIKPRFEGELLRSIMFWSGYFLVIIGVLGRIYSSLYLGGYKNTAIICQGPFSIVRNPLYIFSFIASVGISLESEMITMPFVLCFVFFYYYPKVVAKEEVFLAHNYGDTYKSYLQKVPRWIPNFSLWNEPKMTESMPYFIRRTLMDASVFFMPMPFFVLIKTLQIHHILPVWFSLP